MNEYPLWFNYNSITLFNSAAPFPPPPQSSYVFIIQSEDCYIIW